MTQGVTYSPALADEILGKLAAGQTLREVCRGDGMPDESAVRLWALDDREGFAARYRRAREIGYLSMADEIIEIAHDGSNDWMERTNPRTGATEEVVNHEHINRSRLRVDTLKWALSKALPKIFGDKIAVTGADGGAVETVTRIELVGVAPMPPPPYSDGV